MGLVLDAWPFCMVYKASRAPEAVDSVPGHFRTRTLATTVVLGAVEAH